MKHKFTKKLHLNKANKAMLEIINSIVESYASQGYTLTLRQLYYQLVSRDIVPNKVTEYAKLSRILKKGRMAGVVDWSSIEDRTRQPYLPYSANSIPEALKDLASYFRVNRQEGQSNYVELLVEKDALSGVLRRVTSHYHIRLLVNRGYTSCSAMYKSFQRLSDSALEGQTLVLLYIGDHDPSGLDMVRDTGDRLEEFGQGNFKIKIEHIALTTQQIKKFNPPPNPAKIEDPRAKWYIQNFGKTSWEVDAIDPTNLVDIVTKKIEHYLDLDKFQAMLKKEAKLLNKLKDLSENSREVKQALELVQSELSKKKVLPKDKQNWKSSITRAANLLDL